MLPVLPVLVYGFIGTMMQQFIAFLLRFMTRKTAMFLGYTAAFLTVLNILVVFFLSLFSLIEYVVPDVLSQAASLVVPTNAPFCVSVVVSARIALYVYAAAMKKVTSVYMGPY